MSFFGWVFYCQPWEEVVSRSSTSISSKGMGGMFSVFRGLVGNKALSKVRQVTGRHVLSVADREPGSGAFLTPGPGIQDE